MRPIVAAVLIVCLTATPAVAQPATIDPEYVRVRLTLSQPEQRVTGIALAIHDGILEFANDGGDISQVPLASIDTIEHGTKRASKTVAINTAIAAAIGVFLLAWMFAVGSENKSWAAVFPEVMIFAPPAAGIPIGWYMNRIKWQRITAEVLATELQGAKAGPNPSSRGITDLP